MSSERPLTQDELVELALQIDPNITANVAFISSVAVRVIFRTTTPHRGRLGLPEEISLSGRKWLLRATGGWYGVREKSAERRCQAKYFRKDLAELGQDFSGCFRVVRLMESS